MQLVQVVFWEHKLVQLVVAWPNEPAGAAGEGVVPAVAAEDG